MTSAAIIGDSHTAGAFGTRLAALLVQMDSGLQVAQAGLVGWGVQRWSAALAAGELTELQAVSLVMICLGSNDFWVDDDSFAAQVARLAQQVEQRWPAARLVWVAAPAAPAAPAAWQVPLLLDVLSDRWQVVDSGPLTADLATGPDGLHYPDVAGAAWADRVVAALVAGDELTAPPAARAASALAVVGAVAVGLLCAWRFYRKNR